MYFQEYLDKFGKTPLTAENLVEADFSLFAMLPLLDVVNVMPRIGDIPCKYIDLIGRQYILHGKGKLGALLAPSIFDFLLKAASLPRYQNVVIHDCFIKIDEEEETQSVFFQIDLSEDVSMVVFGSTDDYIVSWKEDFNLSHQDEVPCMHYAAEYVNKYLNKDRKYIFMGHSKGGFESLYAACNVSLGDRLIKAYSLDGPGYHDSVYQQLIKHENFSKCVLFAPRGSVVGRMFNPLVDATIVHSKYHALLQHDPLSWEIESDGSYHRRDSFNKSGTATSDALNHACQNFGHDKLVEFEQGFFHVISAGESKTLSETEKNSRYCFAAYFELSKEDRAMVRSFISHLIEGGALGKNAVK